MKNFFAVLSVVVEYMVLRPILAQVKVRSFRHRHGS
jgi:hypothetical protein